MVPKPESKFLKGLNVFFATLTIMLFVIQVFMYLVISGFLYIGICAMHLIFHFYSPERKIAFLRNMKCNVYGVFILILIFIVINVIFLLSYGGRVRSDILALSIAQILAIFFEGITFILYAKHLTRIYHDEITNISIGGVVSSSSQA